MEIDTGQELHPVIVADLADAASCQTLRNVAMRRGVIVVPLVAAPVDRRMHLLEVYPPKETKPLLFLALPVGAPTEAGFPLRLEPYGELPTPPEPDDAFHDDPPTIVKAAQAAAAQAALSKSHTRDLEAISEPPKTDADPQVGRELAGGKYRLVALVGAGGMGAVYKGYHRDLDKEVAVKILHASFQADPGFASRFKAEALTMSKIDHPNVTRILDFGEEEDGLLYLAMEFLDGVDLQTVLDEQGALPLERLVRLMSGVCSGLGHVHRHGIIHRDVKPTNILLVAGLDEEDETPTEVPKVCDFGIALARTAHVEGGRVAGTPEYMSPEQARGLELDARSDVYACGVLMFELATGKLPFNNPNGSEVARMQVFNEPPKPSAINPDIDPLLEATIMKALSKDPAKRQPSMRHLRAELRELLAPVVQAADGSAKKKNSTPPPSDRISAAKPAAAAENDGWLSGRDEQMGAFFTSLAGTVEHLNVYHEGEELAQALQLDPGPWLHDLAQTIDVEKFNEKVTLLDLPVKKLLKIADATTLSAIILKLRTIIKEEGGVGDRALAAGRVLRSLREPAKLVPLVDKALGGAEELTKELTHVLVEPQAAAAEALLAGRGRHATGHARVRFVAIMRAIGPAGLPHTVNALRACIERGERSGPFVEDLVRAIPPGPNEAAGTVVSELLRGTPERAVVGAGLVALASLWGERAKALLLGALQNQDAHVVTAAVTGLRILRSVDLHVVRRLEPIVTGTATAPDDLRVAAATALGEATPDARTEAATVAMRAWSPPPRSSSVWSSPKAPPPATPAFSMALAKTLIALGVPNASTLIQERAAGSSGEIRRQLASLLPPRL
ncbi:MAG TPA: serine/threonine-protein kinase [Labilithrix sp.]